MKEYFKKLAGLFWTQDVSILYFIFGFLMFTASIVQIDDVPGKADPSLTHPYLTVWVCVILGFFTMFISPLKHQFIARNAVMGFSFFLSVYLIIDAQENIMKGANGVWFAALIVYGFLFIRSYKDLYEDKDRYLKNKTNDNT